MPESREKSAEYLGIGDLINNYSKQQQVVLEQMDIAARNLKNEQLKALDIMAYALDSNYLPYIIWGLCNR
jgi:hypothetical protein